MVETHRKVVARYLDGRLVKGYTFDFGPPKARFHIFPEPSASGTSTQVLLRDLKALFFVRDLVGDPARQDAKQPPASGSTGRLVEVRFRDGETIVGTAEGSWTDNPGFFLVPADEGSNNLRVYVLTAATRAVYPLPTVTRPSARPAPGRSAPPPASAFAPPLLPGRLLGWLTR
jgi:hypothetical protein